MSVRIIRGGALALAALIAALAIALSSGAGTAQATFPGGNGTIACSGALNTAIPDPLPAGQSRLELFSINPDGTGETRLTTNTASDFSPRYSKDGTRVAFVRDNQLWTMDADGTDAVGPLTGPNAVAPAPVTAGTVTFVGDWLPDDSGILIQTNRTGNFEVFRVDPDGTDPVNLTNNATPGANSDSLPAVSPDGTRFAFQSNRAGNPDIWTAKIDGTDLVNLTAGSAAEESGPRWSPDGAQIAFHTDRDVFPRPGVARNLEIYRMSAVDGSGATRLTVSDYDATEGSATSNLTGFDLFPVWSPDGTRIAFHSGRAPEFRSTGAAGIVGQWEVYTIDAVAGESASITRLTTRAGNDERCDWRAIEQFELTVTKTGGGGGTVTSAPAGINCGSDCTQKYDTGTEVTLAASPDGDSTFGGFTGGGCSGSATTCTVTVDEAHNVTARFEAKPYAIATPTPTATPPPSEQKLRPRLTARAKPGRDRKKPFVFRVQGRLLLPSGVSKAAGCKGTVRIVAKKRNKTIGKRRAGVKSTCNYKARVKLRKNAGRRGRVRFQVKFLGNDRLLRAGARTSARYGR